MIKRSLSFGISVEVLTQMLRALIPLQLRDKVVQSVHVKFPAQNSVNIIYVLIPGNPGVIDYYYEFMETIYHENEKKIDIIGIEHAGHSPGDHNDGSFFDIEDQIEHKISLLDHLKQTSPDSHFVLAGHSVGAYICLQILKRRPDFKVRQTHLLLPTVKYIGDTPNGRKLKPLFYDVTRNTVGFLSGLLGYLPLSIRVKMVQIFSDQTEEHARITASNLFCGKVSNNAIYMAGTEMKKIRELDHETVRTYEETLHAFYGQTDGWVPLDHYEDMKLNFPKAKTHLCDADIPHAFVLGYGAKLGKKVSESLKPLHQEEESNTPNDPRLVSFLQEANSRLDKLISMEASRTALEQDNLDPFEGEDDTLKLLNNSKRK